MIVSGCICGTGYDHAIGCGLQHEHIDRHAGCCTPRRYRIVEQWCPTHGALTRWPNRDNDFPELFPEPEVQP